MGYPIRANIFRPGTRENRHFARFPLQIMALYSPSDKSYAGVMHDLFLHLDLLTGRDVVFFAVLDPPADWLQSGLGRSWWDKNREMFGFTGISYDQDLPLLHEIARQFHVGWSELPVLIVSTNLWNNEYAIVQSNPFLVEKQFSSLTQIVREWGEPDLSTVIMELEEKVGQRVLYHAAESQENRVIQRTFDTLATYDPSTKEVNNRYWRYFAPNAIRTANAVLYKLRHPENPDFRARRSFEVDREVIGQDEAYYSQMYAEAQSILVAPASVLRQYRQMYDEQKPEIVADLEEESQIMVEGAATNTRFLEYQLRDNPSLRDRTDFASGASGLWRTLENEINFSIVQAARAARAFIMPEHYVLFVKNYPKDKCKVQTGINKKGEPLFTNINNHDDRHPLSTRHKFLMLGEAYHVVKSMHGNGQENFDAVINSCKTTDNFLPCFLKDLQPIIDIRNPASHNRPLAFSDYQYIWDSIIGHGLLVGLMRIKQIMRSSRKY